MQIFKHLQILTKVKTALYSLLFIFVSFCCSAPKTNIEHLTIKVHKQDEEIKNTEVQVDTLGEATLNITSEIDSTCNCKKNVEDISHNTNISFRARTFNVDTLQSWDNKEALKINSLTLDGFDTIPLQLNKFTQVETLILGYIDWDTVILHDIFPNLKKLKLMGKYLDLTHNPKWLQTIEVIEAEKSKIIGLKSFKQTPNLVEFKISFSGFDQFPSDFNSLKCLRYFQTGAHTHGTIDLTTIDLTPMNCLEFAEFHSWQKNLSGIPKGIDKIETVKIHHANLSEAEREKY